MLVRGIWRVNKLSYDDDEEDRLSDMCMETKEEESKFDEDDYSDLEMFEKDRADEEKRN